MTRSAPTLYAIVAVLVIAGLALLVALVPTGRPGTVHGGAVRNAAGKGSISLLDRPVPPQPEHAAEPNVPRTLDDLRGVDADGNRCAEGKRRIFVLFHGDAVADVSHVDELVKRRGSIVWPLGGAHTRALPVAALLERRPQATSIEIWPCHGEPLRLEVAAVRAAPDRWVLVRTPRVFLKVVDRGEHGRRAIMRNVAAVRLTP